MVACLVDRDGDGEETLVRDLGIDDVVRIILAVENRGPGQTPDTVSPSLRKSFLDALAGFSRESPLCLDAIVGEEEACGLSSLELPVVEAAWTDGDDTLWFRIYGYGAPMELAGLPPRDASNLLSEIVSKTSSAI